MTGRVIPRIVRSPWTRNSLSRRGNSVDLNVIVGFSPVPKKSLVQVAIALCVVGIDAVGVDLDRDLAIGQAVALGLDRAGQVVNRPRTLVNMCRTVDDAPEWLGSMVQTVLTPVVPALVNVSTAHLVSSTVVKTCLRLACAPNT